MPERLAHLSQKATNFKEVQVTPNVVLNVASWLRENLELRSYNEAELAKMRLSMPWFAYSANADKEVLTERSYWMAVDFGFLFAQGISASVANCSWGCLKGGKLNILRNHPVLFKPNKKHSFAPLQVGLVLATKIAESGVQEAKIEETFRTWIENFSRNR